MNYKRAFFIFLATMLASCTVTLEKANVLYTHKRTINSEKYIRPDRPTKSASIASQYRIEDGVLMAGFGRIHFVVAERDTAKPLIVFCGGNQFSEEKEGAYALQTLSPFGDVFLFDYPGYGQSDGTGDVMEFEATKQAIREKIESVTAHRTTRRVIFWGHSFGGGVCANLAASVPEESALLLEGAFANYNDVKDGITGILSPLYSVRVDDNLVNYDIPSILANYQRPVIVVALNHDEVIPYSVTRKLFMKLKVQGKKASFIELDGTGHGNIHKNPEYTVRVMRALQNNELLTKRDSVQ